MWPTPTPIPVSTPSGLSVPDVSGLGQTIGTGVVQGWNYFNSQSFSDLVWIVCLILVIVLGIISIRSHLESL